MTKAKFDEMVHELMTMPYGSMMKLRCLVEKLEEYKEAEYNLDAKFVGVRAAIKSFEDEEVVLQENEEVLDGGK